MDSLLRYLWRHKFLSFIREFLASYMKDVSAVELAEAADKMFDANPKSKIACGLLLVIQGEKINYLTSKRFIVAPPPI